ncbi:MAG TPA: nuclear transport factor 2 family protein [Gemmatimonadaceae bacterium]|nr:nuclear transport factor 2 family protein [Gemmatimonadaceae bacterium]
MTSTLRITTIALLALSSVAVTARAQSSAASQGAAGEHVATAADSSGIREAAMDYIQGWYEGNADRMQRALHPELAKRIVRTDPKTGRSNLGTMGALTLINSTKMGGGSSTPANHRRTDFRLLDIYEGAAVARVDAGDWVDYLELARWNGRWVIVNVLWELRPQSP